MRIILFVLLCLTICQARAVDIKSLEYNAKMTLVSVCSWSGEIAKSVQLVRQVNGDSYEQYRINATSMLLRENLPPEMIQKVLTIGKDVYENVPDTASPTQTFVIFYSDCIQQYSNESEDELHF